MPRPACPGFTSRATGAGNSQEIQRVTPPVRRVLIRQMTRQPPGTFATLIFTTLQPGRSIPMTALTWVMWCPSTCTTSTWPIEISTDDEPVDVEQIDLYDPDTWPSAEKSEAESASSAGGEVDVYDPATWPSTIGSAASGDAIVPLDPYDATTWPKGGFANGFGFNGVGDVARYRLATATCVPCAKCCQRSAKPCESSSASK